MQKSKSKQKHLKPKEQEVFGRVIKDIEIMRELYKESVSLNYSLVDDLCRATERIEKLENGFVKGLLLGGVIVGIVWIISL